MNRLITIPVSHFCEKARWALDLAGVPYVEDGRPPALHRLAVARHRATTVPVLVCDDGTILRDSTAIVRHAAESAPRLKLFGETAAEAQEIERLVARFDDRLGPASRLLVYAATLDDQPRFLETLGVGLSLRRQVALRAGRPVISAIIRRFFGIDDGAVGRARATVDEELAFAADRRGRSLYLVGDRFTAADLAFAALAAPVAPPSGYGGRALRGVDLAPALEPVGAPWRNTSVTGVLGDLYRRHRVTWVTPAAVK